MPAVTRPAKPAHTVGFAPVITLVLWTGCLLVGTLGFTLPYASPRAPTPPPPPVTFQKISVELNPNPRPPAPVPVLSTTPLTSPPLAPPPPVAVAAASPALAFALPVPGPVRVVTTAQAASSSQAASAVQNVPVQTLVFGQGEGRQPPLPYPPAAILQHQEGTVLVRLNVDADGRVTSAEVSSPSRWPLLNETALRMVRDHWHFAPGAPRTYEVAIHFTLHK